MEAKKNPFSSETPYSQDDYDRLNNLKLDSAENTLKLINHLGGEIGKDILRCGLRVYRIIKDIQKAIPAIREDSLRAAAKELGYYRSEQLLEILLIDPDPLLKRRLEYGRLLDSQKGGYPPFITDKSLKAASRLLGIEKDRLWKLLVRDPNLIMGNEQPSNPNDEKKMHGATDYALNILIVYLREHLRMATGKYNYGLIDGFLYEQGITDTVHEESSISRRATRYELQVLKRFYLFFHEIFEAFPIKPPKSLDQILKPLHEMRSLAVDNPQEPHERNVLFPEWEHFLPS